MFWLKLVLYTTFASEILALEKTVRDSQSSIILTSERFLYRHALLHVGGRFQQFDDTEKKRHLVLLPADDRFNQLLVDAAHERLLYGVMKLGILAEGKASFKGRPLTYLEVTSIDAQTLPQLLANCHCTERKDLTLSVAASNLQNQRGIRQMNCGTCGSGERRDIFCLRVLAIIKAYATS